MCMNLSRTLLLLLAFSLPLTPAVSAQDATTAEPHAVPGRVPAGAFQVRSIDRFDFARDGQEPLRCTVRFPLAEAESTQRFPLVIFSHGMGGSSNAFTDLTTLLAGHGYVVVLPNHADSVALRREKGEDATEILRNPRGYTRKVDPIGRVDEIKLIIDNLGLLEEAAAELRDRQGNGRIDRDQIGMAGHSAGAMTSQLVCGVRARYFDRDRGERPRDALTLRSFADERVKAGVLVSGQGTTSRLFTNDSWQHTEIPLLVLAGSRDTSPASDENPQSRRHPFEKSRGRALGGPPAYLIFIDGATHSSYQGPTKFAKLMRDDIDDAEANLIADITATGVLTFLDAYLKQDPEALQRLGTPEQPGNPFDALAPGKVEYGVK
jgi:predicted dienelactone hydrolase